MFYVSSSENNKFFVTNTKDWKAEKYSAEELVKIAESGVRIAGVSHSDVKVLVPEVALCGLFNKWVLAAEAFPVTITPASRWGESWRRGWQLEKIQNLKVSKLDLSSLPIVVVGTASGESIVSALGSEVEIDTLILPDCVSKVYEYAFSCTNIKHIIFNSQYINFGSHAFCASSIEDIYLPIVSGISLDGTFKGCRRLRRAIIDGAYEISRNTFNSCSALQEVHFGESLQVIGVDRIIVPCKTDSRLVESKWYCWCPELTISPEFLCEHPGDWYFADSVTIRTFTSFQMMCEVAEFAELKHKPRLCIHLMPSSEKRMFLSEEVQAFLKANCNVSVVVDDWQKNFNGIPKS